MPTPRRLRKGLSKPKERVTSKVQKRRQDAIRDSAAVAKEHLQQELVAAVRQIKLQKIDLDVLDDQLMQGAVGLDWRRFPREKLEIIKTTYAVHGAAKSGTFERIITVNNPQLESVEENVYMRVLPKALEASQKPSDLARPLFPSAREIAAPVPTGTPLPPIGESIDETPTSKPSGKIPIIEIEG